MTDFSNFFPDPKPEKKFKEPYKGIKKKFPKVTGEQEFNKQLYVKRGGICQITGNKVPMKRACFLHILSKGAYPKYRLFNYNMLLVEEEIHYLYDSSSKEKLLEKYPKAYIIYELKEELKRAYYQYKPETV